MPLVAALALYDTANSIKHVRLPCVPVQAGTLCSPLMQMSCHPKARWWRLPNDCIWAHFICHSQLVFKCVIPSPFRGSDNWQMQRAVRFSVFVKQKN